MSKQKSKRDDQKISEDEGQGQKGNFGSDADTGKDRVSGNDDKSKKDTQRGSPVPVKRQD